MNRIMILSKKATILFTVFVDILGLGIVIPILPFYVQSFGVSDFGITMLFSVFALCSFVSSPFLGALSDRIGRRPVLIISIASTALGWVIFALAQNPFFLFLGRIIDGSAAGNFSTAQSYLSDLSKNDKERTANLGLIGAMFGIGFIIGPMLGGLLGSINHTLPFWVVAFLATINTILAYFNLPETHFPKKSDQSSKLQINPFKPILNAIFDKPLLPGYTAWFLFSLAVSAQQAVFAIYLLRAFNYGEFATGIILTIMGVVIAINQGFLLKKFWIKNFKEPDLEIYLFLFFGLGFLLISFSNFILFVIGIILTTFGQSVLRVVMTSQIVSKAEHKRGEVLGVMNSVMSLGMIIGPFLGGILIIYNIGAPFILSFVLCLIGFAVLFTTHKKSQKIIETNPPVNFPI